MPLYLELLAMASAKALGRLPNRLQVWFTAGVMNSRRSLYSTTFAALGTMIYGTLSARNQQAVTARLFFYRGGRKPDERE